ncbi:MAG: transcription antitermination protein NusB [Flavobacterium sp.]
MLSRRHIRAKVLQSVYAMKISKEDNLAKEEKRMFQSIEDLYGLYYTYLSLFIEIQKKEIENLEVSKTKYLATAEDLSPNEKFVKNIVLEIISNNEKILNEIEKQRINCWYLNEDYIKMLLSEIKSSEKYILYMNDEKNDFKKDLDFLIYIFVNHIVNNEKIFDFLEDYKLSWADDFAIVNTLLLKNLESLTLKNDTLYIRGVFKNHDDQEYTRDLFRKTMLNPNWEKEYEGKTPNWEIERIPIIDIILINMALCEFFKFPSIPVKVTINEYVELAKEYSTPKSSIFINGLLDKLSKEFLENKKIVKIGRGLI